MQAGNILSSDVMSHSSRVVVDGEERDALSWSISRELSGDLPLQVAAGSGITQATGTVRWATGSEPGTNPWNSSSGWLPKKGDRIEIYCGDGPTEWRQFTGLIDSTTGSVGGEPESTIIDEIDKLSATVTQHALLPTMPPAYAGGVSRHCGLSSSYYVDQALRASGFYTTPKQESLCSLHVPMQTSLWPDRGTLETATRYDGRPTYPHNRPAPWGWAMSDFSAEYKPSVSHGPSTNLQFTACVAPNHSGAFLMTAFYGSAENTAALRVTAAKVAVAEVNGVEVCRVPLDEATIVSALYKGATVTLRTSSGATASGSKTRSGNVMGRIQILGQDDARVAGIQVSHPSQAWEEFQSLRHVPSAILEMSDPTLNGVMDAGPAIRSKRADDLLKEISAATLTGMWIDELGVFRWAPAPFLRDRGATKTVTTANDVVGLTWEDSYLGAASRVTIKARIPSVSMSKQPSVLLWSGSGDSMESGDVREEVMEPGPDEDWIMPATNLQVIGTPNWGAFNRRRGTFGGVYYSSDGQTSNENGFTTDITMERISIDQFRIRHEVGYLPPDVSANLSTSPSSPALWDNNRNQPLPRVGGYGRVMWADVEVYPTTISGIGPEYSHDAGPWNSKRGDNEQLERFALYLADQLRTPKPVINGLDIVPDQRLQLGDVIKIYSPSLMGIELRALIVGVRTDFSSGEFSQSLSVRTIGATTQYQSYAEYNSALEGSAITYSQWQALGPNAETYSDLNLSI